MPATPPPTSHRTDEPPKLMLRRDDAEPACAADDLAGLFLGGSPQRGPIAGEISAAAPAKRIQAVEIEGLLLGHLPVFGAAWAGQYAFDLATRRGSPVAMVRLRGGEARVDLIGLRADGVDRSMAQRASLAEALVECSGLSTSWLVQVDDAAEQELAKAAAGEAPMLDGLTLLTGADKAAVVAAYGRIKSISSHRPGRLLLAVLSTSVEQTREVGERLAKAAESFLEQKIRVASLNGKIAPHPSVTIFAGVCGEPFSEVVSLIRQAAISGARHGKAPPAVRNEPDLTREPVLPDEQVLPVVAIPAPPSGEAPTVEGRSAAPGWSGPRFAVRRLRGEDAELAVEWRELTPGCADPASARREVQGNSRPRSLAALLPELTPIAATCPYVKDVELAIGPDGGLHLLAWQSGEQAAVEHLLAAAAWAERHAAILHLALPKLATGVEAVRHLLTERASGVRCLLDTSVRVHAVACSVSGERVCVDLN